MTNKAPETFALLIKPVKFTTVKENGTYVITKAEEILHETREKMIFNFDIFNDKELRKLLPEPILQRTFKFNESNGNITLSTNFVLYPIMRNDDTLNNVAFFNEANTILNKRSIYLHEGFQRVIAYLDEDHKYHATLNPLNVQYYINKEEYTSEEYKDVIKNFLKGFGAWLDEYDEEKGITFKEFDDEDFKPDTFNIYAENTRYDNGFDPDENRKTVVQKLHEILYMFEEVGLITETSKSIEEALRKIKRNIDKLGSSINNEDKKKLENKLLQLSCLMKYMYYDCKNSKEIKYSNVKFDPNSKNPSISFSNASFAGVKSKNVSVALARDVEIHNDRIETPVVINNEEPPQPIPVQPPVQQPAQPPIQQPAQPPIQQQVQPPIQQMQPNNSRQCESVHPIIK